MQTKTNTVERPELFFALVGRAGVRLADLSRTVSEYLKTFRYDTTEIRLSDLLANFTTDWTPEPDPSEYTRITHRQRVAYELRKKLGAAALARAGIASIRSRRHVLTGSADRPAPNHAYVFNQLKHPAEVALLREVYGPSLVVLGGHAPYDVRLKTLSAWMAQNDRRPPHIHRGNAEIVIHVDGKQEGDDDLGQNTRDTYPLADFFADLGVQLGENSVKRFIDLLFGHPFHAPEHDEFGMYQAGASSLRSLDESRQVGAAIVQLRRGADDKIRNATVVASGMNEVPRRGGLLYGYEDSPDGRDQWLMAYRQEDRAKQIKVAALEELIERIKLQQWLVKEKASQAVNQLANELLPNLRGTQFMDIGEFGRTVHAEMAALIDSAKRGVAVQGLTMYVTTYPCHNCAKHIIAAGLRRVVYIEPYPKSKAEFLHEEEIDLDPPGGKEHDDRVAFSGFTGIAPRQYQRLFSMSARGRKNGLPLTEWMQSRPTLSPRYVVRNSAAAYLLAERQELERLPPDVYKWDKVLLSP